MEDVDDAQGAPPIKTLQDEEDMLPMETIKQANLTGGSGGAHASDGESEVSTGSPFATDTKTSPEKKTERRQLVLSTTDDEPLVEADNEAEPLSEKEEKHTTMATKRKRAVVELRAATEAERSAPQVKKPRRSRSGGKARVLSVRGKAARGGRRTAYIPGTPVGKQPIWAKVRFPYDCSILRDDETRRW